MTFETLATPAMIGASLAALLLLISSDWRLSLVTLSVQYSGVFVLTALSWPVEMAVVKLVAGWMAGAVLGMALLGTPRRDEAAKPGEISSSLATLLFRVLAAVSLGLIVLSLAPEAAAWIPGITVAQVFGALTLMGLGLLQLGLTVRPLRVSLGLLTVLSGFEILYAAVESATLVSGLLACVHLGLALVGAYLLGMTTGEETHRWGGS